MKQFYRMIESWNGCSNKLNDNAVVVIPRYRVECIRDTPGRMEHPGAGRMDCVGPVRPFDYASEFDPAERRITHETF